MKGIGIVVIVLVLGLAFLNALFMLIPPSRWLDLPEWISLRGYFSKEKYSAGWGAVQVRLVGLAIASMIGYMVLGAIRFR